MAGSALALAAGLLATPQSPAVAETASEEPSIQAAAEAERDAELVAKARETGQRVEDVSKRDEYSKVYANPDGTWTVSTASGPERMRDEDGELHDLDLTLVQRDGALEPRYGAADVRLSDGGDDNFAEIAESGEVVSWGWPTDLSEPTISGNVATYADAVPGGDLVVTATTYGFTHNIVLRERPEEPVSIEIPIESTAGAVVETPQGGLEITDANGQPLVSAPAPFMWDDSGTPARPGNVEPVDAKVVQTGAATATLKLEPDADYLADPNTEYPVVVDPSFSTNSTSDTWVQTPDFTSSQGSSPELRVGTYDGGSHKARSFLHFENGDSYWAGKHIISANMVVRNFDAKSCSNSAIRATRIVDSWTSSGLTWGNQPNTTNDGYAEYSPAKGYSGSCPSGDAVWNVTPMVQVWAGNTSLNRGIRLKAENETSNNSWRRYRSIQHGSNIPRLDVTYNTVPISGPIAIEGFVDGYVTVEAPMIVGTVFDVDGPWVGGVFRIYEVLGPGSLGDLVFEEATFDAIGQNPYTYVEDVLQEGQYYVAQFWASDGTNGAANWSDPLYFVYDTTYHKVANPSAFYDSTAEGGTIIPANSSRKVSAASVPGVTASTYDVDRLRVLVTATQWTGSASLTIYPDQISTPVPTTPTLVSNAGDNPTTGSSVFADLVPAVEDASLTVKNNGSSPVHVRLTATAWFQFVEAPDDDVVDPALTDPYMSQDGGSDLSRIPAPEVASSDCSEITTASLQAYRATNAIPASQELVVTCNDMGSTSHNAGVGTDQIPDELRQGSLATTNNDSADTDIPAANGLSAGNGSNAVTQVGSCWSQSYSYTEWTAKRYELCNGSPSVVINMCQLNGGTPYECGWMRYVLLRHIQLSKNNTEITVTSQIQWKSEQGRAIGKVAGVTIHIACEYGGCQPNGASSQQLYISEYDKNSQVWTQTFTADVPPPSEEPCPTCTQYHTLSTSVSTTMTGTVPVKPTGIFVPSREIRCDNSTYFNQGPGCVIGSKTPTFSLSLTDPAVWQSALHIEQNQMQFGNGLAPYSPLNRGWPDLRKRNRQAACKGKNIKPSCDEFPFASTMQGCSTNIYCTVKGILTIDNKTSGARLGAFYRRMRVMRYGDPFFVRIDP